MWVEDFQQRGSGSHFPNLWTTGHCLHEAPLGTRNGWTPGNRVNRVEDRKTLPLGAPRGPLLSFPMICGQAHDPHHDREEDAPWKVERGSVLPICHSLQSRSRGESEIPLGQEVRGPREEEGVWDPQGSPIHE